MRRMPLEDPALRTVEPRLAPPAFAARGSFAARASLAALLSLTSLAALTSGCKSPTGCGDLWDLRNGQMQAGGPDCSTFDGTTAAMPPFDYWAGRYDYRKPVGPHFEMSARFSRPVGETDAPVELRFRGGHFGVAKNGYFFWENDEHWTGWHPAPQWSAGENTLQVRQNGKLVEGYLGGERLGSFTLDAEVTGQAAVGVFFKSKTGAAQKVHVADFTAKDAP